MNKEEIIEKLKPIVKPFVKDETAFNSITEKTFGIEIDNDSMEKMLDLENTIAIIQTKLAEK